MKKIALLLLASTLTLGAFAQKKTPVQKQDTVDVSNAQVIKVKGKYYQVAYLTNLNVVYLDNADETQAIYNVLKNCKQSIYSDADLDPIKNILSQQIPQPVRQ